MMVKSRHGSVLLTIHFEKRLTHWTAVFLTSLIAAFVFCAQVRASTIVNDTIWSDNNGSYIKASYGGHITFIDGVYTGWGMTPIKQLMVRIFISTRQRLLAVATGRTS